MKLRPFFSLRYFDTLIMAIEPPHRGLATYALTAAFAGLMLCGVSVAISLPSR